MERARAYNQRIATNGGNGNNKMLSMNEDIDRRAKSAERQYQHSPNNYAPEATTPASRSQSAGRNRTMPIPQSQHQQQHQHRPDPIPNRQRAQPDMPPPPQNDDPQQQHQQQQQEAAVTPELLVDALSGHEDGLLAIAERLMEHYDSGYDVMGEAIIDAFADVQKLFQHVVEAAHMEGAAFEASRREAEMEDLKNNQINPSNNAPGGIPTVSNGTPTRHDEFIDEDVKEALAEAIRKGAPLRDSNQHMECYRLYEQACQSSSALLPVDSDHRGRLQLSIARAESMSPDRACAILRYAMDDVLRSGLRAGRNALPDPSKRGDCVLTKPNENHDGIDEGVVQSSEEALASLVEEMKEVMGAPVYDSTPLQAVAGRFWVALGDAQKSQMKTMERLEHDLGKLKGDFLLARAEWEEKLSVSQEETQLYKKKYQRMKDTSKGENYLSQARVASSKWHESKEERQEVNISYAKSTASGPGSVASIGSSMAQQAKKIAGDFNCAGMNDRTGHVVNDEINGKPSPYHSRSFSTRSQRSTPSRESTSKRRSRRETQYGADF